jgi:signal transduction histidine kinase
MHILVVDDDPIILERSAKAALGQGATFTITLPV